MYLSGRGDMISLAPSITIVVLLEVPPNGYVWLHDLMKVLQGLGEPQKPERDDPW